MATNNRSDLIKQDLAEARRQGKTYNQMYADTREEQYRKGQLSKSAYNKGLAAEMYTPAEVRKEVDSWPQPNTRQQYEAEKKAGGAMTDLTYEQWKALD